jgi:hypothetical protein
MKNQEVEIYNTVSEYNKMLNHETLHPLVSVIDFSKSDPICQHLRQFGFYTVFLKDVMCGDMQYGKHSYDYQEGTLVLLLRDRRMEFIMQVPTFSQPVLLLFFILIY